MSKVPSTKPIQKPEVLVLEVSEITFNELKRENVELQRKIDALRSEWKEIIREVLDERKPTIQQSRDK